MCIQPTEGVNAERRTAQSSGRPPSCATGWEPVNPGPLTAANTYTIIYIPGTLRDTWYVLYGKDWRGTYSFTTVRTKQHSTHQRETLLLTVVGKRSL